MAYSRIVESCRLIYKYTHMPFLTRTWDNQDMLVFCFADVLGQWKFGFFIDNGAPVEMDTFTPNLIICSPTLKYDVSTGQYTGSFVAGGSEYHPYYNVYATKMQTIDAPKYPRLLRIAKTGFLTDNIFCWGENENIVHVEVGGVKSVILLTDCTILRLVYEWEDPYKIIITAARFGSAEVFSLEYNLNTNVHYYLKVGGENVYKCSVFGEEIVYAVKFGDDFEERQLYHSPTFEREWANVARRYSV